MKMCHKTEKILGTPLCEFRPIIFSLVLYNHLYLIVYSIYNIYLQNSVILYILYLFKLRLKNIILFEESIYSIYEFNC